MAAPEHSRARSARAPGAPAEGAAASDRETVSLVVRGRIRVEDGRALCERVRALLEGTGAELVVCDVEAVTDPDVGAVGVLASLELTVRRLGGRLSVRHASRELRELFDLAGLRDVVGLEEELSAADATARGDDEAPPSDARDADP